MRKTIISMLMLASCVGVASAQLTVDTNGKVGVGIETYENLNSLLSVNSMGDADATIHVATAQPIGLQIQRIGSTYPSPICGIYVDNESVGYENIGVYGRTDKNSYPYTARYSYGVLGVAGGATTTYNFGVAGFLSEVYGAGVFGSSSDMFNDIPINGAYAGFFHGDIYSTGSVYASSFYTPSDYRLKSDVKSLESSCLDKVLDMNIVEFKYKQRELESREVSESKSISAACEEERATWHDEESPILKNKHYGLIAQELQEIYPDLVVEGEDGYLGVNYIEIIPLLVRSIQELNAKVEQYENGGSPIKKAATRSTADEATDIDAVVNTLYQNEPNPFTESTVIRCDISKDVVQADLYIYNMNGEQIAEYAVTERGETSIIIDGGSLNAGMYLYALIADGQVVDTKRMILTK